MASNIDYTLSIGTGCSSSLSETRVLKRQLMVPVRNRPSVVGNAPRERIRSGSINYRICTHDTHLISTFFVPQKFVASNLHLQFEATKNNDLTTHLVAKSSACVTSIRHQITTYQNIILCNANSFHFGDHIIADSTTISPDFSNVDLISSRQDLFTTT